MALKILANIIVSALFVMTTSWPLLAQSTNDNRGWIGLTVENMTPTIAASSGWPRPYRGVVVKDLLPGPAFNAGIKPGDVLASLNGMILGSVSDFLRIFDANSQDSTLNIVVFRSGAIMSFPIKLDEIYEGGRTVLGLGLETIGDEVTVTSVDIRSQAANADFLGGIQPADVILEVNQAPVHSIFELISLLTDISNNGMRSAQVLVERGESVRRFTLKLPEPLWAYQGYRKEPIEMPFESHWVETGAGSIPNYIYMNWLSKDDWTIYGQLLDRGDRVLNYWSMQLTQEGSVTHGYKHRTDSEAREPSNGTYKIEDGNFCLSRYDDAGTFLCYNLSYRDNRVVLFNRSRNTSVYEILGVYNTFHISELQDLIQEPITQSESGLAVNARPQACSNQSTFCAELSLKAAACGWAGQAVADRAIGSDTGALGGAATGAACTALMSQAEGLEVDFWDLAIAATSSAFLEGAQESASDGDYFGAIGQAFFGGLAGIAGVAKCEATLQRVCRRP